MAQMVPDDSQQQYVITFPATELQPFAEPVKHEDMKQGRVYFALQFQDDDLLVPVLRPFIFLGFGLEGREPSLRFFQDFESFRSGLRYSHRTAEDDIFFEVYGPQEGKHLFEFDRALEGLMRCALKRRGLADLDHGVVPDSEKLDR